MARFMSLNDEMKEMLPRAEFAMVQREIDHVQKEMSLCVKKEELLTRLNVFNQDLNQKIQDRPTINYFKKVLAAHDEKIDSYSTALEEELKKLTGDHDDQDKEMQQLGKNVADCMRELNAKIGKKEAQHIWAHFENYAMYEDFKELYRKTIPELAKFEQQILNFHAEQERARLIIRGFDYAMTGKANKSVMDSISHDLERNYVRNDDLE